MKSVFNKANTGVQNLITQKTTVTAFDGKQAKFTEWKSFGIFIFANQLIKNDGISTAKTGLSISQKKKIEKLAEPLVKKYAELSPLRCIHNDWALALKPELEIFAQNVDAMLKKAGKLPGCSLKVCATALNESGSHDEKRIQDWDFNAVQLKVVDSKNNQLSQISLGNLIYISPYMGCVGYNSDSLRKDEMVRPIIEALAALKGAPVSLP